MKKHLSLAVMAMLGLTSGLVSAADVNFQKVFGSDFDFGYTENFNITVEGFKSTGDNAKKDFVISTPLVKDITDSEAESYLLLLSKYPMKDYSSASRDPNIDTLYAREQQLTRDNLLEGKVQVNVTSEESDKTANQYGLLVPVDNNGQEGKPSKEFCFNFATEKYAEGEACENFAQSEKSTEDLVLELDNTDEEHNAAGADMNLAGVSHSVNEKTGMVTLTWIAQAGSSSVEIQILDKASGDFKVLGTVPMSQEKFEYPVNTVADEHIIHMIPRDSKGKEKRYDINVRTESDVEPKIEHTPKVGPVEDMMMMVAITIALYAGYRVVVSRKA